MKLPFCRDEEAGSSNASCPFPPLFFEGFAFEGLRPIRFSNEKLNENKKNLHSDIEERDKIQKKSSKILTSDYLLQERVGQVLLPPAHPPLPQT